MMKTRHSRRAVRTNHSCNHGLLLVLDAVVLLLGLFLKLSLLDITRSIVVGDVVYFFVYGLDNGVAMTPPMGWLSWEKYGCEIDCIKNPTTCLSETLIRKQAQLLVEEGYKDVGYTYINIDDCWSNKHGRDPISNKIVPDPIRFPNGMKSLSNFIHSLDLKFGLYGDIGTKTCMGYPGFGDSDDDDDSTRYFELDATTFAIEYEIDMIKVDTCNSNETLFNLTYPLFGHFLNQTGRRIVYSCSWPNDYYEQHNHYEIPDVLNHGIKQTCNMWRNYFDISDDWSNSVVKIIEFYARNSSQDVMIKAAGKGHWNDPDQLLIGDHNGLSLSQQQIQFALWSIFSAPLFISSNLEKISNESKAILQNTEIISVNQDPLGRQGYCIFKNDFTRIWIRELQPMTAAAMIDNHECDGGGDVPTLPRWKLDGDNKTQILLQEKRYSRPRYHRHLRKQSNVTLSSCGQYRRPSSLTAAATQPPPVDTSNTWAIVLENHRTIFNEREITFDIHKHLPKSATTRIGTSIGTTPGKRSKRVRRRLRLFTVRDLIHHVDLGIYQDNFTASVDAVSVQMFKIVLLDDAERNPV